MAYILDLVNETIEPKSGRIELKRYITESSYITKYLSRVVKDKALAVYHVLFYLSWYETGKGTLVFPWAKLGSFIMSEQGNIINHSSTVKRRLPDLIQKECITLVRQRGGANEISVHLPSDIPLCRELIDREEIDSNTEVKIDERDYYTDPERRLEIYSRDNQPCMYCTIKLTEDEFVLDHLIPIVKGGTNRKNNLVTSCDSCNQRKQENDPIEFLLRNYRNKLINQKEYMDLKQRIEEQLEKNIENG